MIFKSDLNEYNNKYFMIGDDKYGLTYVFVRHADSFDFEDIGDHIIDMNRLNNYRTLVFNGVKVELLGNSVYYEDGTLIEQISDMTEISWVDFNEVLNKVKKSINNIGI
jgi:hypothetical protein